MLFKRSWAWYRRDKKEIATQLWLLSADFMQYENTLKLEQKESSFIAHNHFQGYEKLTLLYTAQVHRLYEEYWYVFVPYSS